MWYYQVNGYSHHSIEVVVEFPILAVGLYVIGRRYVSELCHVTGRIFTEKDV